MDLWIYFFGTDHVTRKSPSFVFGGFLVYEVMSEKCHKLSRTWRISGKLFLALDDAKSVYMEVTEFL